MNTTARSQPDHLSSLEPGVVHLERPSPRSPALHQLVDSELARRDGRTLWIDARGDASTYALYETPGARSRLDGIRIARAFTAYQHHTLVRQAIERASRETSLLVVPCTGSLYQDDDVPDHVAHDLLASSLTMLRELATTFEIPVVVTTPGAGSDEEAMVAESADETITCRATDVGLRFDGDSVETLVYWQDGAWQTTLPYWVDLFGCVCDADDVTVPCPVAASVEG